MTREIALEFAIGQPVRTSDGQVIGRLEEVRADDDWRITEYLIGPAGLLERFSVTASSAVGLAWRPRGYRARWDQLDLTDPMHPRVTCDPSQLALIE